MVLTIVYMSDCDFFWVGVLISFFILYFIVWFFLRKTNNPMYKNYFLAFVLTFAFLLFFGSLLLSLNSTFVKDRYFPQKFSKFFSSEGTRGLGSFMDGNYCNTLLSKISFFSKNTLDNKPKGGRYRYSQGAQLVTDIRMLTHKPSESFEFKGKYFTTNQWGIRGRDYKKEKPKGVKRIAVLGGSYVVGSGVEDKEVFSYLAEDKLNKSHSDFQFEIWNFGNAGYDLVQSVYDFELKNSQNFDFDMLIVFSHGIDVYKNIKTISSAYANGIPMPYSFLDSIVGVLNESVSLSENEIFSHLHPKGNEIVENLYLYLYNYCLERNIQPIWIHWPMTVRSVYIAYEDELLMNRVEGLGFSTYNFSDLYKSHSFDTLVVSKSDRHPSPFAHSLVADSLSSVIMSDRNDLIHKTNSSAYEN